ncbi:pilus assembly PilX N-terminal domain-containing protein [Patescibacteria group bacterium]|nr:pilus assembly PilX N-terminal domain-containing protein [Patescibacteria group bacterium]
MIKLQKQKGSALVIALLIIGILMTLALGLSDLVIRESRITTDVVSAGKAHYAAEAGIESALLDLQQNLPGYEIKNAGMVDGTFGNNQNIGISEDIDLDFNYTIENKTKTIPYVDTTFIDPYIAQGNPRKYMYNVLNLNDNITIPLFVAGENGKVVPVTSFRVEYFIDAQVASEMLYAIDISDIDILRWKITGVKADSNPGNKKYFTESIGDYIPSLGGLENNPNCFGTSDATNSINENSVVYNYNCSFLYPYAREAYTYALVNDVLQTVSHTEEENNPMQIKTFLETHTNNYLTMTNIFNPAILQGRSDYEKRSKAKIYYRVVITNKDEYTIREFAKVSSVGFARNLRQRIEAFIPPDSFMPVFNFSLYRTDVGGENDKENPDGYILD